MDYLVDTNILLRIANRNNPQHVVTRTAIRILRERNDRLYVTMQNVVEFWNVATRPIANNGFDLSIDEARQRLRVLERLFTLLTDDSAVYQEWRRLVVAYNVRGVQVHDARLAAAMRAKNIAHILTFNTKDFARYAPDGIVAVHPANVAA
jgi:predicted nucleic acid-binding protein